MGRVPPRWASRLLLPIPVAANLFAGSTQMVGCQSLTHVGTTLPNQWTLPNESGAMPESFCPGLRQWTSNPRGNSPENVKWEKLTKNRGIRAPACSTIFCIPSGAVKSVIGPNLEQEEVHCRHSSPDWNFFCSSGAKLRQSAIRMLCSKANGSGYTSLHWTDLCG